MGWKEKKKINPQLRNYNIRKELKDIKPQAESQPLVTNSLVRLPDTCH